MSTNENGFGRRSLLGAGAAAAGIALLADLEAYPQNVNRSSSPSDLKITDMRIAVLRGPGGEGRMGGRGGFRATIPPATPGAGAASGGVIVVRIDTNQGISGYGQTIGDGPQPNYVLMHKGRLLGENPCNVDKLFRKIKMHGGYNRQGSGVNAIENALWDLAGKAYGVPIYQMLGGKFRDKVRMYSEGDPKSNSIEDIAADYKERVASGFTMLKFDLGVPPILRGKKGTMYAPANYNGSPEIGEGAEYYYQGLEVSDKGCELVADYVASIKEAMGDAADVPMAHDHFGHLTAKSCIKLANALERVTPSMLEDMVPWFRVEEWKLITNSIRVPTLTGEDAYLAESLEALCQARAVDYIHPDHLVIGGLLELKKTSDMAAKYSVGMMVHSNATPIGYAAGAHAIAACQNFLALEWHQPQPAWHKELTDKGDLVVKGYIPVPEGPGLGIKVNEEAMRHLCRQGEFFTDPTTYWDSQVGGEKAYT